MTTIGRVAFQDCTNLTTVTFAGATPPDIDPGAFIGCSNITINVPSGSKPDYSKALTSAIGNLNNVTIETYALPKQPSGGSSEPTKEEHSGPAKKEEYSGSAKEVHSHSYSWVTVQAPGVGQDGIEEYRCSCGAVADRSVIPATQDAVSGMMDAIQNAPSGGNISFDSGRFYTMSDKIIKKLAERSDVITEITFEYQGIAYKMTIPAGIDYTAILADDERFYGYFYFAQLIGATIETR